MRIGDALYNDPQALTLSRRPLLCKRVTLESSVAGLILVGCKNNENHKK